MTDTDAESEVEPATQPASEHDAAETAGQVPADTPAQADAGGSQSTPPEGASAQALYRRAQALMREGRKQEGYETARAAMQQFIADGDDLAWIGLESIEVGDKRIDVHFNMGPKERDPTLDGIVKPLSFRVWSMGDDPRLLRTLDYENGRFGGEVFTAEIGEQRGTVHANFGMLETDATYQEIAQAVIDIVEDM